MTYRPAPELKTSHWFNTRDPLTLAGLKGQVVVVEAFQMLCPGCVSHGLPQAQRVAETFRHEDVVVLGLHTVFEHHAAQGTREALAAFLHEYRIHFPVAIDAPAENGPLPQTMQAWRLEGTPSLVLIDREGCLRNQWFGRHPDLALGAEIMALLRESPGARIDTQPVTQDKQQAVAESSLAGKDTACTDDACPGPASDPPAHSG